MEQFKICEKDTKTKAYSKEGLAREARTDPKEIDREEKRIWLNECLESLGDLVDTIDIEVEKMTSVKGGKTKMKEQVSKATICNICITPTQNDVLTHTHQFCLVSIQLEKLDNRLQKNRWHMARLEQVRRIETYE